MQNVIKNSIFMNLIQYLFKNILPIPFQTYTNKSNPKTLIITMKVLL